MIVMENKEILVVYGISKPFEDILETANGTQITTLWFKEVDIFYFSKKKYMIILSKEDEEIIRKSKECYDKLRALSFKKNITLKRCYDLAL